MRNAILTTVSDSRHPDFSSKPELEVFFRSQREATDAELIIFSDRLNRPIPHIPVPILTTNIILDRWIYYYRFLCATSYDNVLLIDSRDVYFQADPFAYTTSKVLLSSEGLTHKQSTWNFEDQKLFQQQAGISLDTSDWPVVNGGVVLGPAAKVRAYCLLVYTNAMKSPTYTDQAAMNLLYNTSLQHDPDYALADPRKDTFCLTGETVNIKTGDLATSFKEDKIMNEKGKPYALFHQWERTGYAEKILNRYAQRPQR